MISFALSRRSNAETLLTGPTNRDSNSVNTEGYGYSLAMDWSDFTTVGTVSLHEGRFRPA
ncbi:hypothetical protein M1248_32240 [Mycobacterium sp. 29Ha]|nr:hypothetical protein [Mycobacterium sp. 29Ha]